MTQELGLVALVVRDYDEAIEFFVGRLGFDLIEDRPVPEQGKRWVVVAPPGSRGARLLLARAATPEQEGRIGSQTGGRVFLFLETDDFERDYERYRANGVEFVRPPKAEPYGTVAVFRDLCGNLWDLIQPADPPEPRRADAEDFPERNLVAGFEGGAIYTADRDGRFYAIVDEGTMADFLSEEDLAGLELVQTWEFATAEERAAWLARRYGMRPPMDRHPDPGSSSVAP
jgi:catechol 2,3-dioxygenase-like lactoylglutathione lyase family enzyme